MASYVRLLFNGSVELDGNQYSFGSMSRPRYLPVTGEKDERVITVSASATETLWDVTKSTIADFDFLWIQCTRDVTLEFIVDDGNDVGEMAWTVDLTGTGTDREYGAPFILTSDDSYANNTAGFTGTVDVIERIQANNADGSNTSQVLFVAIT